MVVAASAGAHRITETRTAGTSRLRVAYNRLVADILSRIPVVAGVAYRERVRALPSSFNVTLAVEPENRYFRNAIAVLASGERIGYVAPEIAPNYYQVVKESVAPIVCPGRRGSHIDHETSGVEVLLDFSALPPSPAA